MKARRAKRSLRGAMLAGWGLGILVSLGGFVADDALASVAGQVAKAAAQRVGRSVATKAAAQKGAQKAVQRSAQQAVERPRDVIVSRSKHPEAAAHIDHAQKNGQPTVLHLDRKGAPAQRGASTGGVRNDRKPDYERLYDRDEYPPAFTREGGSNANVRFISRHDNRGAGAAMQSQTKGLADGARIRVIVGP